jgi:hypothetical protein
MLNESATTADKVGSELRFMAFGNKTEWNPKAKMKKPSYIPGKLCVIINLVFIFTNLHSFSFHCESEICVQFQLPLLFLTDLKIFTSR